MSTLRVLTCSCNPLGILQDVHTSQFKLAEVSVNINADKVQCDDHLANVHLELYLLDSQGVSLLEQNLSWRAVRSSSKMAD